MGMKRVKYRTKSGKTAYRNIRVATPVAPQGARKRVAKQNNSRLDKDASHVYRRGMAMLGSSIGRHAGMHVADKNKYSQRHELAGTLAGGATGYGLARATEKRLSAHRKAQLGVAALALGGLLHLSGSNKSLNRNAGLAISRLRAQRQQVATGHI